MKVVLKETVKNLGEKGDLKIVADGYARNFLFPKKFAVKADKIALKERENLILKEKRKEEEFMKKIDSLAVKLNSLKVKMKAKARENGDLYGSVKAPEIAVEISKILSENFKPKYLFLESPLRKIGEYQVLAKFKEAGIDKKDREAKIKVIVEKEE